MNVPPPFKQFNFYSSFAQVPATRKRQHLRQKLSCQMHVLKPSEQQRPLNPRHVRATHSMDCSPPQKPVIAKRQHSRASRSRVRSMNDMDVALLELGKLNRRCRDLSEVSSSRRPASNITRRDPGPSHASRPRSHSPLLFTFSRSWQSKPTFKFPREVFSINSKPSFRYLDYSHCCYSR